jgi:hypothetical protein
MQLEKSFLGKVFGFGDISHHAQAKRVDTPLMKGVELGERVVVAGLGARQYIGVCGNWSHRRRLGLCRIVHCGWC